jgi:hypothetical protein
MSLTDSLWLDAIHARAKVMLLPTEKSGRKEPISSGLRTHCSFGRKDQHLCQIRIEGAESAAPGTECELTLAFAAPKGLGNRLAVGTDFVLLFEQIPIGNGKITEDLRKVSFLKRLGL